MEWNHNNQFLQTLWMQLNLEAAPLHSFHLLPSSFNCKDAHQGLLGPFDLHSSNFFDQSQFLHVPFHSIVWRSLHPLFPCNFYFQQKPRNDHSFHFWALWTNVSKRARLNASTKSSEHFLEAFNHLESSCILIGIQRTVLPVFRLQDNCFHAIPRLK